MRWRPLVMASCLVALGCAEGRVLSDASTPRRDARALEDARASEIDSGSSDTGVPSVDASTEDSPASDASLERDVGRPDACVSTIYFVDRDSDGYGGVEAMSACVAPAGFAPRGGDCNDADSAVRPGASDPCDGVDQDCAPGESCPLGCRGAPYGGHDYAYCPTGASWTAARDHCASGGMQLVRIDSSAENVFVGALGGVSNLWIGANDRASEGNFVWIDGGSVTSRHWTSGYPNGTGDCARMNPDDQWVDADCTRTYDFVCESR